MYLKSSTIYGSVIPGSEFIRSLVRQGTISQDAARRLRWFDYYRRCEDARLTCRYFGISAQTFYRWKNRYDPYDLTTLEEASRRPHRIRRSETATAVVEKILEKRQQYPRWGKTKLAVLLSREGIQVSASTVGRVMERLKARGVLVEPENVRQAKLARRRRRKPRYAVRMPKGYRCQRACNNDPSWAAKNNPLDLERGFRYAARTGIVPSGDRAGRRWDDQV